MTSTAPTAVANPVRHDESNDPLRIVVVDDNPGDLRALTQILSRIPDWKVAVSAFSDPREALMEVMAGGADIVLTDHCLGAMTGLELLRDLRGLGLEVPVVLLTGNGNEQIAVEALRKGVSDYIPKSALGESSLRRSITNAIEKARMQDAIRGYQESLARAVDKLRAQNREIQSFYHTVSHELKTPLTATREFISIVLDGLAGPVAHEQRQHLDTARKGCDRIQSLVDDMLDISRLDTGKLHLDLRDVELEPFLRDLERAWANRFDRARVSFEVSVARDLPIVKADEQRLLQILENLLSNSVKFTEPGGRIKLSVRLDETSEHVVFDVSDTGRGIPAQVLGTIFERFTQVSESDSRDEGGLGLGLYVCRELVRLHGGEIDVASEEGKGSEFWFTIPASKGAQGKT